MANAIYPLAKQRLLEWALLGDGPPTGVADLKVVGVTSAYVYSASHEDAGDLTGIVVPATTLLNVTLDLGVVKADETAVTGATVPSTLNALIVYADWGGETLLLAYMDTPGDGSLPASIDSATGFIAFDSDGIFGI